MDSICSIYIVIQEEIWYRYLRNTNMKKMKNKTLYKTVRCYSLFPVYVNVTACVELRSSTHAEDSRGAEREALTTALKNPGPPMKWVLRVPLEDCYGGAPAMEGPKDSNK